jgi:hypothetical protein
MVIIQKELQVSQDWIITYIPRKGILEIQNQSYIEWDELTINLTRAGQTTTCKIQLINEAAQNWHKCWIKHGGQCWELPIPSS